MNANIILSKYSNWKPEQTCAVFRPYNLSLLFSVAAALSCALESRVNAQIFVGSSANFGATSGYIGAFNLDGTAINTRLIQGLNQPTAIATTGGDLFALSRSGSNFVIGEYTKTGATVNSSLITIPTYATDLAINGTTLFASSAAPSYTVNTYSTGGATLSNPLFTTGQSRQTYGLAVSGGFLYWVNRLSSSVWKITTSGTVVSTTFITGLNGPYYIAASGGKIYVGQDGYSGANDRIGAFDATSGATINASFVSGLNDPSAITVAGGNLYVLDSSHGVGVYDANTGATINASLVSSNDVDNAFALAVVVPEPTAWALLAFGTVSILTLRRRRN